MNSNSISASPQPHCTIVPPYLLQALAGCDQEYLAERARETLRLDQLRYEQHAREHALRAGRPAISRSATRARDEAPNRLVHDAGNGTELPGIRVRAEGEPASEDEAVNEAYDGLGQTWQLWHAAYGRNSLDDAGLGLIASVHYGRSYDNAFWDGTQMVFGDGDGEVFLSFTRSLDVIGHELAHGVTQFTSGLNYQDQAGALNEHVSDVFGILVKQRALRLSAHESDWIIGAELLGPGVKGVGLRSMKAPGTAYDDPRLGKDPQPAHMRDFVVTDDDNGGVHINSGIPNRAFHLVATALGGNAWDRAGTIWYAAITGDIKANCDFAGFAALTLTSAEGLHGAGSVEVRAVRDAWTEVGVRAAQVDAPADVPGRVQLRRTGGFAGLVRERTVSLDDLPDTDASVWRSLLAGPTPALQSFAGAGAQPDRFRYDVRCDRPRLEVTLAEPALPTEVRELFDRTLGL